MRAHRSMRAVLTRLAWTLGVLLPVARAQAQPMTAICASDAGRVAGCHALFHDPEGRCVAHLLTGEDGTASAEVPPGGMVTILVDGGSEAGGPAFYTVTDVQPGEAIPLIGPTLPAPPRPPEPPPERKPQAQEGVRRLVLSEVPRARRELFVQHTRVRDGQRGPLLKEIVEPGRAGRVELSWVVAWWPADQEDIEVELLDRVAGGFRVPTRVIWRGPYGPGGGTLHLDLRKELLPTVSTVEIEDGDPVRPLIHWTLSGEPGEADALAVVVTWDGRAGEWAMLVPPAREGTLRLPELPPELQLLGPLRRVRHRPPDLALIDGPLPGYAELRRRRGFLAPVSANDRPLRLSLYLEDK